MLVFLLMSIVLWGALYLGRYKHFIALAALLPLLIWFRLLKIFLVPEFNIQVSLDHYIPFIPVFVIPYILWFLYIAFGCIYTGLKSNEQFFKLLFFLSAGMSAAYIMYMIFPNAITFRPAAVNNSDIFSKLIRLIYSVDAPTSVCPSVHVINAFAVDASLRHTEPFCKKRVLRYLSFTFFIFICLSTVFIKQHSVFDVYLGILVCGLLYIPLYKLEAGTPVRFKKSLRRD